MLLFVVSTDVHYRQIVNNIFVFQLKINRNTTREQSLYINIETDMK